MGGSKTLLLAGSAMIGAMGLYATPAAAQATRTWVSGVGDDANPCSRTAPCKTFAGAISKTATGGEIDCLDPGGFGTLTITKSVTIDCSGTLGSVLASGTIGFTVNAPAGSVVVLRGLTINGAGTTFGTRGINFLSGTSLLIENSIITNFNTTQALGVSFTPSGASTLTLTNVTVANNGTTNAGGGILVQPTGTGSAHVVLNNVRIVRNTNIGLSVNSTGNTGPGNVVAITNSEVSHNGYGMVVINPASTSSGLLVVNHVSIVGNTGYGIAANGPLAQDRITGSLITGNGTGVQFANGATIISYGDNELFGNTNDGGGTGSSGHQ